MGESMITILQITVNGEMCDILSPINCEFGRLPFD